MATIFREISIIVVGVLIALAADEYREYRAERALVRSYLSSLATDLRADSAQFEVMLRPDRLPAQRDATENLQLMLANPDTTPSDALVLGNLRALILLPFVRKRSATFNDLIGSGRLGLIQDAALRRGLAEYYAGPVGGAAYESYLNVSWYPLTHRLAVALGPGRYAAMHQCPILVGDDPAALACYEAASQGDELEILRSDAELSALVVNQAMQQFLALLVVERADAQAQRILEALDRHLAS